MGKAVNKQKQGTPGTASAKAPPPVRAPVRVPPLFRGIDWFTLAVTFALVWIAYFLTLAPEQTLEDSGELCTGAFYAGIPHPPGYPFWAIYSWLWTALLPVGNVAWRVEVGEATAAAMACGLVAFLVSRGSSMLVEGIGELRGIASKWESAICLVSGTVAGLLLGLGDVMWSESVAINRISLFGVPWVMIVLLCLLRWIYAPHQRRYLYCAMFFFGICATIHQTLLVAAMGIEVAIAAVQPRLGRDLFLGNSIVYVLGLIGKSAHLTTMLDTAPMVLVIYHFVGIGSIVVWVWLATRTKGLGTELLAVVFMGLLWLAGASFYFYEPISGMSTPPMQWGYPRTVDGFFHALSRGQYERANPTDIFHDPGRFITQLGILVGDVAGEFNWVLVFVALVPLLFLFKMQKRERAWIIGLTATYLCIGVLLMILMNTSPDRQSADLNKVFFTSSHGVVAIMAGYGLALIASYMATHYQRFRPWGMMGGAVAAMLAIYSFAGLTGGTYFGKGAKVSLSQLFALVGHTFTNKDQYGLPVYAGLILIGITVAFLIGLLVYRNRAPLAITLGLFALMPLYSALCHWGSSEQRNHWFGYWFGHDMFTPPFVAPDGKFSYDPKLREQATKGPNGHLVYPEMTKDAVLYGGTDPGRFCPTYMIFCESFIPDLCKPAFDQKFDRRDVYLITQNALADGTYLCYLRSQYNRSQQIDPPFFQELLRSNREKQDNYTTNLLARMVIPLDRFFASVGAHVEKRRRTFTSWFKPDHFTNLPAFVAKLRPSDGQDALSRYLFENLSKETQALITGQADEARLRKALTDDLNVLLEREQKVKQALREKKQEKGDVDERISNGDTSEPLRRKQEQLTRENAELSKIGPLYDTDRFAAVKFSDYLSSFLRQNLEIERLEGEHPEIEYPDNSARIRLNRLLLEAAYPGEIAKSLGGVYPDREIYMASPEDSSLCFSNYLQDAQRRLEHDRRFPNEPPQLKPGEDVHIVNEGGLQRVQVTGQVAVMSINGLITKVIFDHNPGHEFFVEESFPLDWMYPHLTPFGIIMKINRQPLPELTEEIVQRDHEFWSRFSERLIGNWITYDTPVKDIADFVEKVYLRHDFRGFKGDRKFIRDDQAQKAFSKLRSSISGIYAWRVYSYSKSPAEQQRMIREADFAFRQAFAFCPYSPEAVFRYAAQFLPNLGRLDDALLVANTCLKLDPHNGQVRNLAKSLSEARNRQANLKQAQVSLQQLEAEVRNHTTNFQAALNLAAIYLQMQQTDRAVQILDQVQSNPQADLTTVLNVASALAQINRLDKLEPVLEKLVKLEPERPEVWYDLAALKAALGKQAEVFLALRKALEFNAKQLARDPNAKNLTNELMRDPRFDAVRQTPEFQRLIPPS